MPRLPKALQIFLVAIALLGAGATASAFWLVGGSGDGSGAVAGMPAGEQPSGTVAGRSVSLSWPQSSFLGSPLGSYGGGGYTVRRRPAGGGVALTPGAGCAALVAGGAATLACVETAVDYGAWTYTVTPELSSFVGATSPASATLTVAPAAPVLNSVTALNPTSLESTGSIALAWSAASGATGYNVYRRVSGGGAYVFTAPLNGAVPVSATNYDDPGAELAAATTYEYVVRALAGSPAVASASSSQRSAETIARPAAPAGSVTATAAPAARIDVSWSAVAGVAGYNVYRRTPAGGYDFNAPLNLAIPVTATTYPDTSAVDGSSYVYAVRSLIVGAGGDQVRSSSSADSATVTADATAPAQTTAVSVNSGGPVLAAATCAVAVGTRYVNNAGKASVSVTATIPAPEAGETVVFLATTPGSTAVIDVVVASGTSVSTTLDLSTLLDGVVTLTARTRDAAGNMSVTRAPSNVVIKDVVAAALSGVSYVNVALFADKIEGTSECGAKITATETAPRADVFTHVVGTGGTFSLTADALSLVAYRYEVTATDRAGNVSAATVLSGTLVL
jgi:hypothetical protein